MLSSLVTVVWNNVGADLEEVASENRGRAVARAGNGILFGQI